MGIIGASQALDPGSIPGRRRAAFWGISSIGRVRALQARGTGIETPMLQWRSFFVFILLFRRGEPSAPPRASPLSALVAQLVEHGSNKPRVGGSSPSWSMNGWMAERSKALVSGTSLFGGVGSNPTPVTHYLFAPAKIFFCFRGKTKKKKKVLPPWDSNPRPQD